MENKESNIKGQWNLHGYLILTDGNDYYWGRFTPIPSPWKNEKQFIAMSGSCWIMNDTVLLSPRTADSTIAMGKDNPTNVIVAKLPKWNKTKYCIGFDWTGKVSELRNCGTGKLVADKEVIAAIMPNIMTLVKTVMADVPVSK